MRHFAFLDDARRAELFHRLPGYVAPEGDRLQIATGLGATLYSPGTRADLAADARRQAAAGVASMVFCLEDAVADDEVAVAETNVVRALRELAASPPALLPLIFVRVPRARRSTASRPARWRTSSLATSSIPPARRDAPLGQAILV